MPLFVDETHEIGYLLGHRESSGSSSRTKTSLRCRLRTSATWSPSAL